MYALPKKEAMKLQKAIDESRRSVTIDLDRRPVCCARPILRFARVQVPTF
jgi:hypothetical protein